MSDIIEKASAGIVADILADYKKGRTIDNMVNAFNQLDKNVVIELVDKLIKIIYPGYFRDKRYKIYDIENHLALLIEDAMYNLNKQIVLGLNYKYSHLLRIRATEDVEAEAETITTEFFKKIPQIREYIESDVQAAFDGDPAAKSRDEIIFAYPGLLAIVIHRIAHQLYLMDVPMIPRIMSEYAHERTGVDIHPGATIGHNFFIDHATGIVIGETTLIGNNVKIYQGVTLGALSTRGGQKLKGVRRHPTIEDDVTIYSGASILGGDTVIGKGSVIGGNAFITTSIPAGTTVTIKSQELIYNNRGKKAVKEESIELEQDKNWFYVI